MCSERIKNWPTKERPRERLLAEGPARLTDAGAQRNRPGAGEAADRLARDINAEVEAMILGAKPVSG